jgi:hypothetical protein
MPTSQIVSVNVVYVLDALRRARLIEHLESFQRWVGPT